MTRFYLGTHKPHHLALAGVPLFVSHRRLREYAEMPHAIAPWALDSGGFTALAGEDAAWDTTPEEYVRWVRRYRDEVGMLEWAAPQDWMCEGWVLENVQKKQLTSGTVAEHQIRTVQNFIALRNLAPELPFIPVLQGWWDYFNHEQAGSYADCAEMYERAGVDLAAYPVVGIGSVCRKQATGMAFMRNLSAQLQPLSDRGVKFHGFGFKTDGLELIAEAVRMEGPAYPRHLSMNIFASVDSMAWSYDARAPKGQTSGKPLPEHAGQHKHCGNCIAYGLQWRKRLLDKVPEVLEA